MVSRVTAIPVGLAYYRVAMLTAKGGLMSERDGWYFNCPPKVPNDYEKIFIAFDILQLKQDQSYQI